MRGRPKKENPRDIMYKIRLNAEEDHMLTQASLWTGQPKSKVFRSAILGYYKNVEIMVNRDMEAAGYPTDHLIQQRLIKCPYPDCDEEFVVDFAKFSKVHESDGPMGERYAHVFDTSDIECPECCRRIHAIGIISEYPVGACEYDKISIKEEE